MTATPVPPFGPSTPDRLLDAGDAAGGLWSLVPGDPIIWAGIVGAGLVGLTATLLVVNTRRDRLAHGPTFRRLARGLGLAPGDRRWLGALSRRAGIGRPAAVLVSRGCFEYAVQRLGSDRAANRRADRLRHAIFDD